MVGGGVKKPSIRTQIHFLWPATGILHATDALLTNDADSLLNERRPPRINDLWDSDKRSRPHRMGSGFLALLKLPVRSGASFQSELS